MFKSSGGIYYVHGLWGLLEIDMSSIKLIEKCKKLWEPITKMQSSQDQGFLFAHWCLSRPMWAWYIAGAQEYLLNWIEMLNVCII